MWPVAEFYNKSNKLAAGELRLIIFRQKGRGDLAIYFVYGKNVQRLYLFLGPQSSFLDLQTLPHRLFTWLQRVFNLEDEGDRRHRRAKYGNMVADLLELAQQIGEEPVAM